MKIVWAMDAFEDNKELNQKMALCLKQLHHVTQADIQPLYLLRENEIVLPTYEVPTWVTDHSKTAESLFLEVLQDYNLPFLTDPKVIPHASQSHSGAAETLVDYAQQIRADLIVVGSHSRQGFQRFILGSFAESLLLQSHVPVLVIGTHTNRMNSFKNILFPTEFGDHSKENFKHVLQVAKTFKSEVTLLHIITRPVESLFDLETRPQVYNYKGKMLTLEQIIEHQIEHQKQRAQHWIEWAQKEGVTAHFVVDNSFRPVDDVILESIDRMEMDLVIMEAQSGPMSAAILGSYSRNVARKAHCPVYVITRKYYEKTGEQFTDAHPPM